MGGASLRKGIGLRSLVMGAMPQFPLRVWKENYEGTWLMPSLNLSLLRARAELPSHLCLGVPVPQAQIHALDWYHLSLVSGSLHHASCFLPEWESHVPPSSAAGLRGERLRLGFPGPETVRPCWGGGGGAGLIRE